MAAEVGGLSRRALIDEGAARLRSAGVESARREALRIWTDLFDEDTPTALLAPEEAAPRQVQAYREAVRRRTAGEPLAHVTGRIGFRRLVLRSDPRALIPRPETEGLVELVLAHVQGGRVADIGTGTGCIAMSLATEGTFDAVVGIDLSADALDLAAANRRLTGARVSLVRGDLTGPLAPASLDALVSNPPYLTAGEHAVLDPSVREWEPAVALAGGADGLEAIGRILEDGRTVVRPGGWLALEVDSARAGECARRAGAFGWTDVAIHADLFGRERYLLGRRSDTR
jgi:release factor glutamine methyltransferase